MQQQLNGRDPPDAIAEQVHDIQQRVERLAAIAATDGLRETGARSPYITAKRVRQVQKLRSLRERHLGRGLFADPAWDIMLDLYAAYLGKERISVSSACIASGVPPTTALRWISKLESEGLLMREPDPADARRQFILLSPKAVAAMVRIFDQATDLALLT